jgi:hypothetical protein
MVEEDMEDPISLLYEGVVAQTGPSSLLGPYLDQGVAPEVQSPPYLA